MMQVEGFVLDTAAAKTAPARKFLRPAKWLTGLRFSRVWKAGLVNFQKERVDLDNLLQNGRESWKSAWSTQIMGKTAGAITQTEVEAVTRGAIKGGAKRVEVEAKSKDGRTIRIVAFADKADDPTMTKQSNGSLEQDMQEIKL